ncbi:AMIN domain-containing protein [Thiovibrio sp. JS02]
MSILPRSLAAMACLFLLAMTTLPVPPSFARAAETAQGKGRRARNLPVIFFDYSVVEGHDELLLLADGPLDKYKIFRMEGPPRLILDIPGVGLLENVVGLPVNRPELSRIRIARHPDKVRFVFDLTEQVPVRHEVVKLDKGLKVVLIPKNQDRKKAPSPPTAVAEQRADNTVPPASAPAAESGKETKTPAGGEILTLTHITRLFGNQRVTILFHKASAKDFFSFVAEKSNTRITVSPEVTEAISLRLTDVTLGEAVTAVVGHLDLVLSREKEQIFVRSAKTRKSATADSI